MIKLKITMTDGKAYRFTNYRHKTLTDFIKNELDGYIWYQLNEDSATLKISNISTIEVEK